MTSIQPPLQKPPPFLSSAAALPAGDRRAGEQDFASLLSAEGAERAVLTVAPGESERSDLEAGLAHVFNAFGFFPANREATQKPASSPSPVAPTAAAQPAADQRGVDGRSAATLMPHAIEHASPAGTLSAGLNEFEPRETQGAEDLLVGGRVTQVELGSAREAPSHSAQPGHPSRAPQPRGLPLQLVGIARAHAAESLNGSVDESQPAEPVRPAGSEARPESSDRLTFRIGDQAVELVGRLATLDDPDERALIEALQELLGGHGLALGAATLNGRAIELGKIRRQI